MFRSGRRSIRAFRRDEGGATAVEFAFVAPLLFFALLSIVELGMLGMMSSGLDNAVVRISRMIRTGRSDGPTSAGQFKDQLCNVMGGNSTDCHNRLTISVQKFTKFSDAGAAVTSQPNGVFDKGAAGDIVIVKANYRWPLLTPFVATAFDRNGPTEVILSSRLVFKNEPYQ